MAMFSFAFAGNRATGPRANNSLASISAALAPTPDNDTLSTGHRTVTYTDSTGPAVANPTPIATGTPVCSGVNDAD